jgi:Ca2+-binding EF-hand superfamily protein
MAVGSGARGAAALHALKDAFEAFASFGTSAQTEMDNSHFAKMCKECGIIDKTFTPTDADLIFNKTKAKAARKLTFAEFKEKALPEIATKKKMSVEELTALVQSKSPQSSGTQAEETRFHDDKSQYTGVYKAGGPTNVDRDNLALGGVVDRRVGNDARGGLTGPKATGAPQRRQSNAKADDGDAAEATEAPAEEEAKDETKHDEKPAPPPAPPAGEPSSAPRPKPKAAPAAAANLRDAFEAFASFGTSAQTEMDNSHFAKMCKECGIIDKAFTPTDADLIFNKTKAKAARKLTFAEFKEKALTEIATKKKMSVEELTALVQSKSPQSSGTQAEETRFHDDKSQYTGVYKAGGPTNVDRDNLALGGVVDRRVGNDARGGLTGPKATGAPQRRQSEAPEAAEATPEAEAPASGRSGKAVPAPPPKDSDTKPRPKKA